MDSAETATDGQTVTGESFSGDLVKGGWRNLMSGEQDDTKSSATLKQWRDMVRHAFTKEQLRSIEQNQRMLGKQLSPMHQTKFERTLRLRAGKIRQEVCQKAIEEAEKDYQATMAKIGD